MESYRSSKDHEYALKPTLSVTALFLSFKGIFINNRFLGVGYDLPFFFGKRIAFWQAICQGQFSPYLEFLSDMASEISGAMFFAI